MNEFLTAVLLLSLLLTFQSNAQPEEQPDHIEGANSFVYRTVDGIKLRLHVFSANAQTPSPSIIFFFGGGWRQGNIMQFVPQSRHLQSRGMTAIVADYRVLNRHQSTVADALNDAKAAMSWVRERATELNINPDRIAAAGGSAGGHLATAIATVNRSEEFSSYAPNALALFNPATNTGRFIGDQRTEQFQGRGIELSPFHQMDSRIPPTIILHGTADTIVPYSDVDEFCEKAKGLSSRCELYSYEGATHGFFNYERNGGEWYRSTMLEVDKFFTDLGYLPAPSPTRIE